MGKFVDFREVKAKVSIEQVLGLFEITGLKKQGSELRGKCFLHSGDGKRTLAVNLEKGLWTCFSCKAGGDTLDLAAALKDCSIREAALLLQETFLENGEPEVGVCKGAVLEGVLAQDVERETADGGVCRRPGDPSDLRVRRGR